MQMAVMEPVIYPADKAYMIFAQADLELEADFDGNA